MALKLLFKRLCEDAQIPVYHTQGSSGFDFVSIESKKILPYSTRVIRTGLVAEIPPGYEIQIRPRSGLATQGITVFNAPGTIDSDYRGEIGIILYNGFKTPFLVNKGMRIAQGVIAKTYKDEVEITETVDELTQTKRGAGGFGHTGIF